MQSTHWGADDSVDELLYDSKSVDDWGVNRDMQGAYRQVARLFAKGMRIAHFGGAVKCALLCKWGSHMAA